MHAGERLKNLRNRLGITTREVEEFSRKIAQEEGNEYFQISNAWLTQIENTDAVPSIHKLFSLSIIYRTGFHELLALFDVDLTKIFRYQFSLPLDRTHLLTLGVTDESQPVMFPVRFDRGFNIERSSLLSRMVEVWGEVPVPVIQSLDLRHSLYGYIGQKDFTLYPLLRPGSFVQIDGEKNEIQHGPWRTELDRPIYFIELRDGYACAWCELLNGKLTLIPHPLSSCSTQQFAWPEEAEVVGQVTGVAMRLVNYSEDYSRGISKLPRRS
ncbi:MAG TPA: helix-turn-helix transcriptional regulator [Candidatus Acidoferrales bacterium]|nr:helix-turn-helix transcriptional regulator [Candidatus Acidoferrales bacterium]